MSSGSPPALDDRAVEQLLTGRSGAADPELARALGLVRSMGSGPAPRPTPALAELLTAGFESEVLSAPRPARRRPWVARAATALTAAAASLLVAGTAQALPAPLQDGLAGVVRALTPFDLPDSRPTDDWSPVDGSGTGRAPAEPGPPPASSGPDRGTPAPASGSRSGAEHGATAGAVTGGRGPAATEPPARGPDSPRPPVPEVARDEPGPAVREAPQARRTDPSSAPPGSEAAPDPAAGPVTPADGTPAAPDQGRAGPGDGGSAAAGISAERR